MEPFALIQQLHHQLDLLTRAIHQPPGTAISAGNLVQLAPESHPVYSGYLMDVRNLSETRASGPILANYRGAWISIPIHQLVRVGLAPFPRPHFGFEAEPILEAQLRQARNEAHAEEVRRVSALRAAAIARRKAHEARKA